MRTLGALQLAQEQIARETLDVCAPLAHRLGMQEVRNELEDLAFAALYPKRYAEIDRLLAEQTPAQDAYVESVSQTISERLSKVSVQARDQENKHHWAVYEKWW